MATAHETTEIPEFPLFAPDGPEVAFGADKSRYYGGGNWDAAKSPCRALSRSLRDEEQAFSAMFYCNKSLNDAGYRPRPDLDEQTVMRALVSLMRSWGVSSEQKHATVALAIHRWCEPLPASVDRSGEAGETALAGSTEGESAVPAQQGDAQ